MLKQEFDRWVESQGLEVPCTASQYAARVIDFLRRFELAPMIFEALFADLMDAGVGPDWRNFP
jgi:hypothetical protein